MTSKEKIKRTILLSFLGNCKDKSYLTKLKDPNFNTGELWSDYLNDLTDYINEFRCGEYKTELPALYNRNYESFSVASRMFDGSYVGWTYWYGGGKHGCPEEIDWMSDAYNVSFTEKEVISTVKKWKVIDG